MKYNILSNIKSTFLLLLTDLQRSTLSLPTYNSFSPFVEQTVRGAITVEEREEERDRDGWGEIYRVRERVREREREEEGKW